MIIVTGGAGFIGSNIVKALNNAGHTDILVVDDLTDGHKFVNLVDAKISDYIDYEIFIEKIINDHLDGKIEVIFHQGACSDTTEWDGRYMLENNYEYSKLLLHYCQNHKIPFIYASSAAIYGANQTFVEDPANEKPLNVYGYSKLLFDQYVRRIFPIATSQIVGLRYFNVYGPNEQHKGSMASVAFHLHNQLKKGDTVKLFSSSDSYGPGEQRRDFIYVGDVAAVALWFWQHKEKTGIFNLGTGRSQPFNDIANAVTAWHKRGKIEYIPFPEHLKGHYQSFTEANIEKLRQAGYAEPFKTVEEGVKLYLDSL